MTLEEPAMSVRDAAAAGSSNAMDEDDMRETKAFFHMLDLEDVERESDYRRMDANRAWDEGD